MTILLHDELPTFVPLNQCPFETNYEQEKYLREVWAHYNSHQLLIPLNEWPQWIKEGVNFINYIDSADREKEMDKKQ